jgi:hypothetical protein
MMTYPHKLLMYYERGVLTPLELQNRLIEAAVERSPEELAAVLPADILAAIRDRVADAPGDEGVYIFGGMLIPGTDPDEFFAERKRVYNEGCRRWRMYFGIAD